MPKHGEIGKGRNRAKSPAANYRHAKPLKGMGEDPAKIEALLREHPVELALFREAMKHQGRRTDLHNNIMEVDQRPREQTSRSSAKHGTSRAYTLSRLKNQRPDLFDKVANGELSANRAAIEASRKRSRVTM